MNRTIRCGIWPVLACLHLVTTGIPGQEPLPRDPAAKAALGQELTVPGLFELEKKMLRPFPRPLLWLDDEHYLSFDQPSEKEGKEGKEGEEGEAKAAGRGFLKVHAGRGDVSGYLDPGIMASALASLPGFTLDAATALVRRQEVFHWNARHDAVLLNTGGDLIYYDPHAPAVRRLTHTPGKEVGEEFSPDSKLVAFVHGHNLAVVGVDGSPARSLSSGGNKELLHGRLDWVYQEELYGRGNYKGFWWSPDSAHIAFLRLDESKVMESTLVSDVPTRPLVEVENYPKAGDANPGVSLAVAPVRGGDVTWFDLARYGTLEILIARVAWHPSSQEVFFQVQDREQRWLDLLAGDIQTGKVRLVLRERSGSWVIADAQPQWLEGGKTFLWLSERDGYKHVYRYDHQGKIQGRLTQGEYEVDKILGVDEKAGLVYFLTDRSNIKEQQLWRMGLDGRDAMAVTQKAGWHQVRMSPLCTKFIDSHSSWEERERVQVVQADGKVIREIGSSDMSVLAPFRLSPVEFVQVKARDGFVMEAMMIKPRGYEKGRRVPTMCFTYSGPHAQMVRNRWGGRPYLWHQLLAQKGYLVWVCDVRSASGKGLMSAAACFKNLGVTEMRDLEDGIQWLVDEGYADPARVGIWGWSYGGYQTSYCLTHSKRWSLGIAVNPVTDWRLYDSIYTERYMSLPQTNPEGYASSSVIAAAKDLHGKLLLVAATMDDNVHMQNSLQLACALQEHGKQFRFMVYPRVRHLIRDPKQQQHLYQMMTDFVLDNL